TRVISGEGLSARAAGPGADAQAASAKADAKARRRMRDGKAVACMRGPGRRVASRERDCRAGAADAMSIVAMPRDASQWQRLQPRAFRLPRLRRPGEGCR